ncbi:MAG: PDZ domain-containing protein [Chloroflexi bacterium]|nr:PDZ domain-containing protein [Chloroflexota bacterium]
MKAVPSILIRLLVLTALMLSSAVAFAQDEAETELSAVPFMGIRYTGVEDGLFITGVIPNTPAATADLQPNDIVTAVNGEAIQVETVRQLVWIYDVGASIDLSLLRDGQAMEQSLTLMARPDDVFNNPDYPMPLDLASIGLFVGQCGDHLLVIGAVHGSQVAQAGFHLYDEIVEIDGDRVSSIPQADAAVADLAVGDELSIVILRDDREMVFKTNVEDQRRRRNPRRRPHPRADIKTNYSTDMISVGYGDDFVQVLMISPAHELYAAGLRAYDVVTEANGEPITKANSLFDSESIELTVARTDGSLHFDVPGSAAALLMLGYARPAEQDQTQWLGLHEKQVTLGVRYLQLEPDSEYFANTEIANGAYIVEVIEGLPAEAAGILEGDIIVAVAGEAVTQELDLRNRIYFHEPGEVIRLDLLRGGELMQVEVTLRVAK